VNIFEKCSWALENFLDQYCGCKCIKAVVAPSWEFQSRLFVFFWVVWLKPEFHRRAWHPKTASTYYSGASDFEFKLLCVCSCLLLLSLFAWFLTRWTWHRSRLRWFHFVWPKHPLWTLFLHLNSCSGNHQDLTHSLSLTIYTGLRKIRLSQTVFLINGLPCLRRKCRCLHAFDMELVFGAWAGSSWQSMARNSIVAPGTPIHPSSQFASAYWNCLDVLPCTVLLADVFLSLRHSCKFIISFFLRARIHNEKDPVTIGLALLFFRVFN